MTMLGIVWCFGFTFIWIGCLTGLFVGGILVYVWLLRAVWFVDEFAFAGMFVV